MQLKKNGIFSQCKIGCFLNRYFLNYLDKNLKKLSVLHFNSIQCCNLWLFFVLFLLRLKFIVILFGYLQ